MWSVFQTYAQKVWSTFQNVKDLKESDVDLFVTVSGDGTILRLLRILDSSVPFLCVNVGGRGILSEIKPGQVEMALDKIPVRRIYILREDCAFALQSQIRICHLP